jgi:hypothetical protein
MRPNRRRAAAGAVSHDDILKAARHAVFNDLIAKLRGRYTLRCIERIHGVEMEFFLHDLMDAFGPVDDIDPIDATPQLAYDTVQILIGMRDHEDAKERTNAVTWARAVIDAFNKGKSNGKGNPGGG